MTLAYWNAVARGLGLTAASVVGLAVASVVGLSPGAASAEPSQIGAVAAAAVAEEAKSPAAEPAPGIGHPGSGQLKPDAASIDATGKSPAADSGAASGADKSTPVVAAPPPPPPPPSLLVDIDLTKQRMSVSEHGKVRHSWPISSGRDGYRTPTGSFRPAWMAKMWYSKQYDDAPMPHAVFFNGGIAVHATQSTGMLGRPASHGCIRLSPANAATFYAMVSSHGKSMTRIKVFGTARDSTPMASKPRRPVDGYARVERPRALPPGYVARYPSQQRYSYSGYSGYGGGYGGPSPRYIYPGDPVPYGYRSARPIYRSYNGPRGAYD